MFKAEATWVALLVGLAAVGGRTYLGRYVMSKRLPDDDYRKAVRFTLWADREYFVAHFLNCHDYPWDDCPVAREVAAVGWDVAAYVVAASFDCRELLDD